MAGRKKFRIYKRIISELGLLQLDVYREFNKKEKKIIDIIRIYDPSKNVVFTVNLNAPREALQPSDFLEKLVEAAEKNNISLPERKLNQLRESFSQRNTTSTLEEESIQQ